MRADLQGLGVAFGDDFEILLDRAWQVHRLRRDGDEQVSRSSIIYAVMRLQPLVLAVFELCGLRLRAFERRLGLESPPVFDEPRDGIDFEVGSDTTVRAFTDYHSRWPQRPLDALGLAVAIVTNSSGQVERHLTAAGLRLDDAASRLIGFVNASPGHFIAAKSVDYSFSGLVRAILDEATRVIVSEGITYPPMTTTSVAVAILRTPAGELTAPTFLQQWIAEHAEQTTLDETIPKWLEWYDRGRETSVVDSFTQTLTSIFERAAWIAFHASKSETITARHLVGALIASARFENIGSGDLLTELGIDPVDLARAFLKYLENNAPPTGADDLIAWRRFLEIRDESFMPRFHNENAAGEDWLDIGGHVNAFATLIASKSITPPLSIGLFGDWGSGKSFFMAKLREEITERARSSDRPNSPYHARIVQIDFNAWHYVESNLWASLVEHVFSNLKLTTGDTPDAIKRRREELAKRLDELIADRAAAEERIQKAEIARDLSVQELDAKKKLADTTAAGARGIRAKDAWEIVTFGPEVAELQNALQKMGLGAVLKSKEAVRKTLDDLRSTGSRASMTTTWILRQPWPLVGLVIIIVLAPIAASSLLKANSFAWLTPFSEKLLQALAPLAAGVAWIAKRLGSANTVLEKLDTARSQVDAKVEAAEITRQAEIAAADQKLETAVTEVETAKAALEHNEQEVAKAKSDLVELSSGRRLARFIDERAASDDYRKLLGVLATVRHDFSTLSSLMHPVEGEDPVPDAYRIDRIVLYIDDLDRCEPSRVVQVLQAVHLLLAFKLFVVVVGVDARWVESSLRQKHRALRGSVAVASDQDAVLGYEAEPHDYLEKIFQVPFWLQPLKPATTASYINRLLINDVRPRSDGDSQEQSEQRRSGVGSSTGAQQQIRVATNKPRRRRAAADDPKVLQIEEVERRFMTVEPIARLVGRSPRTAKRFVNTYRFFRASVAADDPDQYLDRSSGTARYERALTMLAIVVGAPDVSLELFAEMKDAPSTMTVSDFAAGIRKTHEADEHYNDWRNVAAALNIVGGSGSLVSALTDEIETVARYSFRLPYGDLKSRRNTTRTSKAKMTINADIAVTPVTT